MVKRNKLNAYFRNFDLFSKNIAFRENGEDSFGSIFGAFTSLIILLIVATYGINKFSIMLDYGDTNFNEYKVKNALYQ